MKELIADNVMSILKRIDLACARSGRSPGDVRLLMATKTVSADRIKAAILAGQALIGENKMQELKEKHHALADVPHENHYIGHLQSNKINDLLKYDVTCVQSVDRLSIAEKLNQRMLSAGKTMEVMIQVNTSHEQSKFGIAPEACIDLLKSVSKLEALKIRGLMTIGLFSADTEKVRACYRLLKELQQQILSLQIPGITRLELSMGMSGDFETAIEEGATIVRVGTAIFGPRQYPDSYYWQEDNHKQVAG